MQGIDKNSKSLIGYANDVNSLGFIFWCTYTSKSLHSSISIVAGILVECSPFP